MKSELFNKIDACVIVSDTNRYYFTRFDCSNGCVILTPDKKFFITDFRYEYTAREKLKDYEISVVQGKEKFNEAARILKKLNAKHVGIEDTVLYSVYKEQKAALSDFSVKSISSILSSMRAVKSEEEITLIANALKTTETALQKSLKIVKAGTTERELAAEIMYNMLLLGAEKDAFTGIIAGGPNASYPHYHTGDREFEKGDLVMVDIGAKVNGYCSDMTRTFAVGTPPKNMQKIYNDVLDAQNYALANIKAGITAHEADSFARELLLSRGYGKEFGHSLGHGVGIDIHETPFIAPNSEIVLEENMVITVEPGVYVQDTGGVRIEDLVVVTKTGVRNLTSFSKDMNL